MSFLPEFIENEKLLDDVLTTPSENLIEMMKRLDGDIMILGIGGKMGITLGGLAVRAIQAAGVKKNVYGVSRFSDVQGRKVLEEFGVQTIACDLLDLTAVQKLPQVKNIIFMAGKKFGTDGGAEITWAMNTVVPANVCQHFKSSRVVAFSTGCVYPLLPPGSGGATETTPVAPIGDYAQSALGRERVFEYFSKGNHMPVCLYRLNYAIDLRYGVLRDIGEKVLNGEPVDITSSHVNVIWQGDANAQALYCLELCTVPSNRINITGPETLPVKWIAEEFGRIFGVSVGFTGVPADGMYLNNSAYATEKFGYPHVSPRIMIRWLAHWLKIGGRSLGKPTHFEVTSGRY